MVPPPKPAASKVRIPQAHSTSRAGCAGQARPLAFKALLMTPMKPAAPPKAKADPVRTAETTVRSPERDPEVKAKVKEDPKTRDHDLLDPTARITAHLAPPVVSPSSTPAAETVTRSRVSLEELIPQVLKRIAWGGDRTKGSVHLELTSGEKVTVHAEGRRVRLEVEGNADLERRIGSRLRAAGIEVESVR